MDTANQPQRPSTWRVVLAFILDFFMVFWVFGLLIARIFGGATEGGFNLTGGPAILLFALMIGYFVICNRYLGGTIWKRILKAR
ncbi:RDD family protein [Rhizobium sp. CG5]|uniref:hypothetical protein n=1 Tax=Rhizobium sp. CG5 TaxID=2726076 RepID=UPI002033426B|nr:hypothetical protein [Rhizobium sp. CG5]MCM2473233.1 RDD family protein [Rhizobium sp. CG5]